MSIVEGIYLEEKKSQLSDGPHGFHGDVSQFLCRGGRGGSVLAFLLDDDLGLTGIKER